MTINEVLKRLDQAKKVLKAVGALAVVAAGTRDILSRSLPSLKIPRLRRGSSDKGEVKKLYDQLVAELKTERAAHEQTRQYLRWATKEIENVKEAMRDWQTKALAKGPRGRRSNRKSA